MRLRLLLLISVCAWLAAAKPVVEVDADGTRTLKTAMLLLSLPTDYTWSYRHNLGRLNMISNLLDRHADLRVESRFELADEGSQDVVDTLDRWGREGIHLVITTSFGFQDETLNASTHYPGTNWVHISGFKSGPQNFATAWCRVFQSRYIVGITAASQTTTKKIAYVASFPFIPEVVRGFNAFTLGARSADPQIEVYTAFLMSWHDSPRTQFGAEWLVALGCDVITGHTNDRTLYQSAEKGGIKAIGYYADMRESYGDQVAQSAFFTWGPMYTRYAEETLAGLNISSAFDGMERRVPAISGMSQFVPRATRLKVKETESRFLAGEDLHPAHGGSAVIFCGPINDEYGDVMLQNSSDCADLVSYPKPYFQQFGGGLLNMEWYVQGVVDLGVITLPHEDCAAGSMYTFIPEGRKVMDNSRAQRADHPGKEKTRMAFTCTPCGPGHFSPTPGSTTCTVCEAGTYSPGQSGTFNASGCLKCPVNSFAGASGAASCESCPSGTFNLGEGNTGCPFQTTSDPWVTANWWVLVVAGGGLLLLVGGPLGWIFTAQRRRMAKLFNNNMIAESCAESIAAMRLEEVGYIREIPSPNRIQLAFITIIDNLSKYRMFIPANVLADLDEPAEQEKSPQVIAAGLLSPTVMSATASSEPRKSRFSIAISMKSQSQMSRRTSKSRMSFAQAAKNDAKFQLSLKSKKIVFAVLGTDPIGHTSDMCGLYSRFLGAVEQASQSTKGYVQVVNGIVGMSFGAVMHSGVASQSACRACAMVRDKWTEGGTFRCGISVGQAQCGNIGTDTSRHFVHLSAIAVPQAHALSRLSEEREVKVLCDDRTNTEVQASFVTRVVDCVLIKVSVTGAQPERAEKAKFVYEVEHQRPEGENDEWMYKLEQQQAEKSVSGSISSVWQAIRGGTVDPVQALNEIRDVASTENRLMEGDRVFAHLQRVLAWCGRNDAEAQRSYRTLLTDHHSECPACV